MADLESQLGDSQMPYMKVKITYSHSAFSDYFGNEILVGVSQRCTRLETTAVGALKRHNVRSPWSPPPIYSLESITSAMQKHWKPEIVTEWLQRINSPGAVVNRQCPPQQYKPDSSSQETRHEVPLHRPTLSLEDICQKMPSNRRPEPNHYRRSLHYGGGRPELQLDSNTGSMRSRLSGNRNSSGTTNTTGSLRQKKSFAAGIWRSLTPSINASKADGEEQAQGAWTWNAWF